MAGPLDGIQVLDLTRILAGPFATMRLADMGARVIKVEIPGQGDDTRTFGPPFVNGESAYFLSINRNKQSLTLNLRTDKGRQVLTKLIESSDVVIENFRPGTLERLGFPYEHMRGINPRIIYCAISGYGQTGPRSKDPSYDVIVQGESGLMELTGQPDGPPTKVGISLADVAGGLSAVEGVLLALLHRSKTGTGQKVDISLLDSLLALFTYQAQGYFATGRPPQRLGNLHPTATPYESFATKDGHFNIGIANDSFWRSLLQTLRRVAEGSKDTLASLVDKLKDEKFAIVASRIEHRSELRAILDKLFLHRATDEWLELLGGAGIPCGRINRLSDVLESDLLRARQMVLAVNHPQVGSIRMVGIPIKLSESPGEVRLPPPLLAQHTDEILAELGYSVGEIRQMRAEGVI